jgi:ankyrin repeat protein
MVSTQTPSANSRFYQAIRQDDLPALQALVNSEGVDAKDAQGQTPLMLAAAFGSPEALRLLIANGADVNATSNSGVTALHWAVTSVTKTRMLLDANADVRARSQLGRTPLIVAASATGTADVVRLLISKGAEVNVADTTGVTPLIAAANVDDLDVAKILLARGADAHASARTGPPSTPLMGAAINGDAQLVRELLLRKPDLTVVSADRASNVKNGPVRFGHLTALHAAITGGNPDVVELLLKAGAPVDALDIRGMTPLMWAVATDRAQPRIVRLLLAWAAQPRAESPEGQSAVDWARKFNHPAVLAELKAGPVAESHRSDFEPARELPTAHQAVVRSLPLLRAASYRMLSDGGCVACHAQPMTGLAIGSARLRGWTASAAETESTQSARSLAANGPQLMQLRDGGGLPDGPVYTALLLADQHVPPSQSTDVLVHYLAAKQRREGNWHGVGGTRAPIQDGDFSRTALSIRAFTVYATPSRAHEYKERATRAAAWLASHTPITTEDRVMQLLGLRWAKTDLRVLHARRQELQALQRSDGGWAQTRYLSSDAYATGQVLYALRELGVPATDAALQRGAAWLRRTQHEDGSWHVKSRAMKIQPYFESGFPHGDDQWISQAATAWATVGLTATAIDEPEVGTGTTATAPSR